jgi:hypothetical protein
MAASYYRRGRGNYSTLKIRYRVTYNYHFLQKVHGQCSSKALYFPLRWSIPRFCAVRVQHSTRFSSASEKTGEEVEEEGASGIAAAVAFSSPLQ